VDGGGDEGHGHVPWRTGGAAELRRSSAGFDPKRTFLDSRAFARETQNPAIHPIKSMLL
jgi:hypothetical protein